MKSCHLPSLLLSFDRSVYVVLLNLIWQKKFAHCCLLIFSTWYVRLFFSSFDHNDGENLGTVAIFFWSDSSWIGYHLIFRAKMVKIKKGKYWMHIYLVCGLFLNMYTIYRPQVLEPFFESRPKISIKGCLIIFKKIC